MATKKKSAIQRVAAMRARELAKDMKMLTTRIAGSTGAEKKKLLDEAEKLAQQLESAKAQAKG